MTKQLFTTVSMVIRHQLCLSAWGAPYYCGSRYHGAFICPTPQM